MLINRAIIGLRIFTIQHTNGDWEIRIAHGTQQTRQDPVGFVMTEQISLGDAVNAKLHHFQLNSAGLHPNAFIVVLAKNHRLAIFQNQLAISGGGLFRE